MSTEMLDAALAYAKAGLFVIPLEPRGKLPLLKRWQDRATTDANTVNSWWTKHPDANIGIHVGRSNLVVVDVDPRNTGDRSLDALCRVHGRDWLSTISTKTGGGGWHYLYRQTIDPAGIPGTLAKGVDCKRGSGFIVVPPSIHPSGNRYTVERGDLTADGLDWLLPVPEWFATAQRIKGEAADPDDWTADISIDFPEVNDNLARLQLALDCLDPDCPYEDWRNIVFAILSTGWQSAKDIARAWSQRAADRYDSTAFRTLVDSFKTNKANGISVSTLFHLAKEHGYVDPRKKTDNREAREIDLLRADQIEPTPIRWLMVGWLALGKLILLAGSPGTGKTTLALTMASIVTSGSQWPDGNKCLNPGSVVIWSGEDDPADTLIPRLLAANADLSRVHFVGGAVDTINGERRAFDPARDMPALRREIARLNDVRMLIVDPVVAAVAGDSHKNSEVRRALQPLVDLAAEVDAVLVGITHFTKGTGGKDTTERETGSLAFAALARIVLATARDTEVGDYLLTRSKSNIGPDGGGWRYQLEQIDLEQYPSITASRVVFGEALTGFARDLIAEAEGSADKKEDGSPVEQWLRLLLTAGPMKAADVYTIGHEQGYGERRLQRALKKIGGNSQREGFGGATSWSLPGHDKPADGNGDGFADDEL